MRNESGMTGTSGTSGMIGTVKKCLVSGFGTGYLRPAPGTWGSLAIVLIYLLLAPWACNHVYSEAAAFWRLNIPLIAILLFSCVVCVALGPFTEKAFGKKDPSYCTIDEWAGQALALIALPLPMEAMVRDGVLFSNLFAWQPALLVAGVAFFAFRLFDITKPPPARQLEKCPKGWGVLLDDLAAGVYANLTAQLVLRFALNLHAG